MEKYEGIINTLMNQGIAVTFLVAILVSLASGVIYLFKWIKPFIEDLLKQHITLISSLVVFVEEAREQFIHIKQSNDENISIISETRDNTIRISQKMDSLLEQSGIYKKE